MCSVYDATWVAICFHCLLATLATKWTPFINILVFFLFVFLELLKPSCGSRTCSRTSKLRKSFLLCQNNNSVIILFVLTLEFCSRRWISECRVVQGAEAASIYRILTDSMFMLEAIASGVVVIVTFVWCAAAACLWWVTRHVWNAFPQHTNSTPAARNTHCSTDDCLCYSGQNRKTQQTFSFSNTFSKSDSSIITSTFCFRKLPDGEITNPVWYQTSRKSLSKIKTTPTHNKTLKQLLDSLITPIWGCPHGRGLI